MRFFSAILSVLIAGCTALDSPAARLVYPITVKTNQVDNYHGTLVADPYRWLEDDNSAATKSWVEAENKVTFAYFQKIAQRPAIEKRLRELWDYERYYTPVKRGSRYFFMCNKGLQNQSVLYTFTNLSDSPQILLDPNALSADGTVSLAGDYNVSNDGNLVAYGLSRAGSDWQDWKVRDVRTGQDFADELHWVKFSGASWSKDNLGFYYSRYDAPAKTDELKGVNQFHKLFYHRLGTSQSEDRLVYERKDHPDWMFNGTITDDGHYLIIHVSQGMDKRNRFFYQDLQTSNSPVVELLNDLDADYGFIDNVGDVFYFKTGFNAPRKRVIAIDLLNPSRDAWREIIPESADKLESVSLVGDQFIATYLHDAYYTAKIFKRDGSQPREIKLPGFGTVDGFGGKRADTETFYQFGSFTTPGTIYHYDVASGKSSVFRQPKVLFNAADYETRQVFYSSKDGTRVPMFIVAKKGVKLNGNNPVFLTGYGGFNISQTPGFSPPAILGLEMGVIFVQANLRGGGEYGDAWHQAGMKTRKQNVFDDFMAAAEWLIANHYTRPAKLAIAGGSNGGLLVGACLTQRPELFGAALASVGVMDMLRFEKFTIGWAWNPEYGSPENADEFKALYAYSPLHHVKPGVKYPATLISTGDHDDRVVPAHSFKFAAALQAAQAGSKPILIRVETRAGHGAGTPTSKTIQHSADNWSFIVKELDLHPTFNEPFHDQLLYHGTKEP
jgi:prolyl oligopeptidase